MIISETVHCALVVLGELASAYGNTAVSASQISESNHIPQSMIDEAIRRLIDIDVISIDIPDYDISTPLFLSKYPDEIYIADIIVSLEQNVFNGYFKGTDGKHLPQSRLSYCLNRLRYRCKSSVISHMKGLSINVLAQWSELNSENRIETSVIPK